MINHTRTLLINTAAGATRDLSPIYIDPDFQPLTVPTSCRELYRTLTPTGGTLTDLVACVDGLMAVMHIGELEPYTLRFDTRVTYGNVVPASVVDLYRLPTTSQAVITQLLQRIERLPLLGHTSTALFDWPEYASDMRDLASVCTSDVVGLLRVGAIFLAYTYQMERVRRSTV